MNFWLATLPKNSYGGHILSIHFFFHLWYKDKEDFYPPKSVIVLRQFGVKFLARYAPQKFIRGAYIINEVIFPFVVQR